MGIFSTASPFDQIVEKATLETNTKEDWALILDVCDRVTHDPKDCLRSIVKRLNHQDPHVVVQAVTLLDACVNNCGLPFHLEIASREFEQEFQRLIQKIRERTIREKLLGCLQKWALNEFKNNPQLDLIPTLYSKLRHSGVEFPSASGSPSKGKAEYGSSSRKSAQTGHTVSAQQEQDDLAKAIELSLKETQKPSQGRSSLYPSMAPAADSVDSGKQHSNTKNGKEPQKVRALYDFEAAEDNELTFYAGEIVHVIDDADPNWWEGTNQRGQGLFPSNFVTADLNAEPEPTKAEESSKKQVKFNEEVSVASIDVVEAVTEVEETKIDQLLEMLHDADPVGEMVDPPELELLEDHVHKMAPLIDQELEKIDRSHAQLTKLGGELVGALNMYHQLMRGQPLSMNPPYMPHGYPTGAPPGQNYFAPGMPVPPQMYANSADMANNSSASMGPSGLSHYPHNYMDQASNVPQNNMHPPPPENTSYGYSPYGNPVNENMASMPNQSLHHATSPQPHHYGNMGAEHANMVAPNQPGVHQYNPAGHQQ